LDTLLQEGAVLGVEQSRQLHKPTWSVALQAFNTALTARSSTEPRSGFQKWQIGFAWTVLLHALAGSDTDISAAADLRQKRVDQRRLANPRLPCNKHDLTLASQGFLEHVLELSELQFSPHDT
jgi:hypothetical protein